MSVEPIVLAAVQVLGDDATIDRVAAAADLPRQVVTGAIGALRDAGRLAGAQVLRPVGDNLEPPPTDLARDLHARAAAVLHEEGAPDEDVARHLCLGAPVRQPWAIEALRNASKARHRAGDQRGAAALLARALEERPPQDQFDEIALQLARTEGKFDADAAVARYRAVLPRLSQQARRFDGRLRLAEVLASMNRVSEALEEADAARNDGPTEIERARADLTFASIARQTLDTRPLALPRLRRAVGHVAAVEGDHSARAVLGELAYEQALAGEVPHDEVAATALVALGGETLEGVHDLDPLTRHVVVLTLCWCGETRTAWRATNLILERGRRLGIDAEIAAARQVNVTIQWNREDPLATVAAADDVLSAVRFEAGLPGIVGIRAAALAFLGRADEAIAALALPGGEKHWAGMATFHGYLEGKATAQLAVGDYEGALRSALRLGVLAGVMGTMNPAVLPWRSAASVAAGALGDTASAVALAEEALARARRFGAPGPIAVALRARARVAPPDAATPLLREAMTMLEATPRRLTRARCAFDLARALAATGERVEAIALARRGVEEAGEVHSAAVVAEGEELMGELGAGSRPERIGVRGGHADVRLNVRVLGTFVVVDGTGRDVTPGGMAGKAVRVIVGEGRPLHVEELAERLWDEPLSTPQARARVPNVVSRARTPGGPLLQRHDDLVRLAPGVSVDVDRFEATVTAAMAEVDPSRAMETGVAATLLYTGDLLPTDPYADWAAVRREHVRRRYLAVSDLTARLAADAGVIEVAIDVLEAAIRHDPYDVERYEVAAAILEEAGRHSAARAMRARAGRTRQELGLGP